MPPNSLSSYEEKQPSVQNKQDEGKENRYERKGGCLIKRKEGDAEGCVLFAEKAGLGARSRI